MQTQWIYTFYNFMIYRVLYIFLIKQISKSYHLHQLQQTTYLYTVICGELINLQSSTTLVNF